MPRDRIIWQGHSDVTNKVEKDVCILIYFIYFVRSVKHQEDQFHFIWQCELYNFTKYQ